MQYRTELLELLSKEYNCSPEVFLADKNTLTVSKLIDGRRVYSPEKYFFHMVTLGSGAVITADEILHPFLREFVKDRTGHWLFELPNLLPLERELGKYDHTLTGTYHMFLPHNDVMPAKNYSVRWFFGEEIYAFYGDERFPNAICPKFDPNRPDRIVVCAYDGEELMGMAGASEDAKDWLQIGIDVIPRYRSMSVATYLVTILKNKILELGKIPFYGTSVSNYHSWNVAINSGFRPAWVEIGAKKIIDKRE